MTIPEELVGLKEGDECEYYGGGKWLSAIFVRCDGGGLVQLKYHDGPGVVIRIPSHVRTLAERDAAQAAKEERVKAVEDECRSLVADLRAMAYKIPFEPDRLYESNGNCEKRLRKFIDVQCDCLRAEAEKEPIDGI